VSNAFFKSQKTAIECFLSLRARPIEFTKRVRGCTVGWVDIGTRTKVPLKFFAYLSKTTKINEKSVLTQ
jgi:hypothetical protein